MKSTTIQPSNWFVGVCVHQESFSVQGISVSLQTDYVTDTKTVHLEQMKLFAQVKVTAHKDE